MNKIIGGLLLSLAIPFTTAHAEVSPETIINIFQRLEILEKTSRELHGKNEELQHQIKQLKKQQKDGFLNLDTRMGQISSFKNPQILPDASYQPQVKIIDKPKSTEPQNSAPALKPEIKKTNPVTAANPVGRALTPEEKIVVPKLPTNNPGASRPPSAYEKETYQVAFDLMKKSSTAATKAFREYIILQPNSPLAANAQYWIGEIMYSHNNYKGAVEEFILVLQKYKYSAKAPDAALKLGYSFFALKKWVYARRTFEDILKYFPENQNAVSLATKRLEKMKAAGN